MRSVLAQITRAQQLQSNSVRQFSSSFGAVLVLSNLYPHPSASAAGVRTNYMLRQLCRDPDWESVHYATGAATSSSEPSGNETVKELIKEGVTFHSIPPNRSMQIKQLLHEIGPLSLVFFDRFYAEEAYSFHVYNHCPEALRVVDMQDMHSLRQGRMKIVKESSSYSWDCIDDALRHCPSHQDHLLLRELASLYRSDLTLVCSPYEYRLLTDTYKLPSCKLCMAPFWISKSTEVTPRTFDDRRDFVFIGGFRHKPNVDAVNQLAHCLWPRIRERLPDARLHVYGAYCPPSIQSLSDSSSGFLVHGFAPSLRDSLMDKRVMLAPLRYGAGIKGKILDAWTFGVPVVTTPIGSEGIESPLLPKRRKDDWGGIVASNINDFVDGAVRLYTNRDYWTNATCNADSILSNQFAEKQFDGVVSNALKDAVQSRRERRRNDYVGSLLWHQGTRSTEYFSRWIECKENKNR